jgi:hypothetical protein
MHHQKEKENPNASKTPKLQSCVPIRTANPGHMTPLHSKKDRVPTFGIEIVALGLEAVQIMRLDAQLEEQVMDVREVVEPQALARPHRPVGRLLCSPHAGYNKTSEHKTHTQYMK